VHTFARRLISTLAALMVAAAGATVPTPVVAAPAPWTWARIRVHVAIEPHGYYSIAAPCPFGFTAITGGLEVPIGSSVYRNAEYRYGDSWFVALENPSSSSGDAWVIAECVEIADLPAISHNYVDVTASGGWAQGVVSCPNVGEVALTGGAGWNNVNTRTIRWSGPTWSGDAWFARGYNSVAGAKLTVEVYCVNINDVPGFTQLEVDFGGSSFWKTSLICPQGTRIMTGGTQAHFGGGTTYASYPNLTSWTATGYQNTGDSTYLRAICVSAGSPTVEITYATPGPNGALTSNTVAGFYFTGSDPAGYSNTFKCSLDGSPAATCYSGGYVGPLASGDHEFVVLNTTPDGRLSGPATYHWTVDAIPPSLTLKPLPAVTLATSAVVRWTGSDQHSSISHYQAAYRLAHANGSSAGWKAPTSWSHLAGSSVRTPSLSPGDTVCVAVRAYDAAANVSPWSGPRCTTRPLDDRALTASSGWARATGSTYWLKTVTRSTLAKKTLRRTGLAVNRVGVVATVCPGCGVVGLWVGQTLIGKVDLRASVTRHRRILLLPGVALRTATVTVKTVSSGKKVEIDGLVAIQRRTDHPG